MGEMPHLQKYEAKLGRINTRYETVYEYTNAADWIVLPREQHTIRCVIGMSVMLNSQVPCEALRSTTPIGCTSEQDLVCSCLYHFCMGRSPHASWPPGSRRSTRCWEIKRDYYQTTQHRQRWGYRAMSCLLVELESGLVVFWFVSRAHADSNWYLWKMTSFCSMKGLQWCSLKPEDFTGSSVAYLMPVPMAMGGHVSESRLD